MDEIMAKIYATLVQKGLKSLYEDVPEKLRNRIKEILQENLKNEQR